MKSDSAPFRVSIRKFDRGSMHMGTIVEVTNGMWWSVNMLHVLLHGALLPSGAQYLRRADCLRVTDHG